MEPRRLSIRRADVIVGILSILLAAVLAYPALNGNKRLHDQVRCENYQREIAQAIGRYENSKHRFPAYTVRMLMSADGGRQRQAVLKSWIVASLEMLSKEQYDAIHKNLDTQPAELKWFQCPSARLEGEFISYVANCGRKDAAGTSGNIPPDWKSNGVFMKESMQQGGSRDEIVKGTDISDGKAYTLLISENLQAMRWTDTDEAAIGFVWFPEPNPEAPDPPSRRINVGRDTKLEEANYDYARPSSWHPGGVVAAFCDGRTDFIADTIDYRVYCQLMTSDGQRAREPGANTLTVDMYR